MTGQVWSNEWNHINKRVFRDFVTKQSLNNKQSQMKIHLGGLRPGKVKVMNRVIEIKEYLGVLQSTRVRAMNKII